MTISAAVFFEIDHKTFLNLVIFFLTSILHIRISGTIYTFDGAQKIKDIQLILKLELADRKWPLPLSLTLKLCSGFNTTSYICNSKQLQINGLYAWALAY
jgi:hypothetical protein